MADAAQETTAKNKLHINHLKLGKIKDADLSAAPARLSLRNEITRFRELLVEMETGFCKRLTEVTGEEEIKKVSDEYITLTSKYEEFIETKEIQLNNAVATHETPAPAPPNPAAQDPSPADKAAITQACITAAKLQIQQDLQEITTKFGDATEMGDLKRQQLSANIDEVKKDIDVRFQALYREKATILPAQATSIMDEYVKERSSLQSEILTLQHKLAGTAPDQSSMFHGFTTQNLGARGTSTPLNATQHAQGSSTPVIDPTLFQSYKSHYSMYKPSEPPTFMDPKNYAAYPMFKKEWQQVVSVGKSAVWIIANLNRCTTDKVDLSSCKTVDEAWQELDMHFGNPMTVATDVMETFGRFKPEGNDFQRIVTLCDTVMAVHRNLESVNQTCMITNNMFTLTQIIRHLPRVYQKDFSKVRSNHNATRGDHNDSMLDTMNAEDLWKLLLDFLKTEKRDAITYHADEVYKKPPPATSTRKVNAATTGKGKSSPPNKSGGSGGKPKLTEQEIAERRRLKHLEYGKCPVCQGDHTFTTHKGTFASSKLHDCQKWKSFNQQQKLDAVIKAKACTNCTNWRHEFKDCDATWRKCGHSDGSTECDKKHSRYFHGMTHQAVNHLQVDPSPSMVLLHVQRIMLTPSVSTIVLFDDGATISIITHELAGILGLPYEERWETIAFAGHDPVTQLVKIYDLKIRLNNGQLKMIKCLGYEHITEDSVRVNVDCVYEMFPDVPYGSIERPEGPIQLLIGQDQADILPLVVKRKGALRVSSSRVGTGWVIGGHHPAIKLPSNYSVANHVEKWRTATISSSKVVNHVTSHHPRPLPMSNHQQTPHHTCCHVKTKDCPPLDFMQAEETGVHIQPRCKKCLTCPKCSFQETGMSLKEFQELEELKAGLSYDPEAKRLTLEYAYNDKVTMMHDNRHQVEKRAISLEKSLKKRGYVEQYNKTVDEYIERGVWVKVEEKELIEWKEKGLPMHYIAHHCVVKEESLSTKTRIVLDSTLKNNYTGPSLNDVLKKGPNGLAPLFNVFTRWRSYQVAMILDLSKAYHMIKSGKLEKMTRLVVWRHCKEEEDFQVYGNDCMGMGDRPATNGLEIGVDKAADLGEKIDEKAAQKLKEDRFADDVLSGGTWEEVMRMRGKLKIDEKGKITFDGTIPKILDLVSFVAKVIIISGENDEKVLEKLGKVLGHTWHPLEDLLEFALTINLSPKTSSGRTGSDLTADDVKKMEVFIFTRRICLAILAGFYDPSGLLSCYLVRWKIALKDLNQFQLGWDDPVPDDHQQVWRKLVEEALLSEPIKFHRSIRVEDCLGRPELIIFFDGSSLAYCGVVYCRWRLATGGWHTRLVSSKVRVTSQQGMTIPRSELSALVLSVRLADSLMKSLEARPSRVSIMGDSTCTIASCEIGCTSLAPYFSNRVAEIIEKMQSWGETSPAKMNEELLEVPEEDQTVVDLIYHLPGVVNPGDWPTRGTFGWQDIGLDSQWQTGPDFIREPRDTWPVTRDFVTEVPKEERVSKYHRMINTIRSQGIPRPKAPSTFTLVREIMTYSNSLLKVRGIVARVLRAVIPKIKERASIPNALNGEDYLLADKVMKLCSMPETADMLKTTSLSSLSPFLWEGLLCTRGRLGKRGMLSKIGHPQMVILSPKSALAKLIMIEAHEQDHRQDPGDTLWRSRKGGMWIVRGRNLAKTVTSGCIKCRIANQKPSEQLMADLPDEVQDLDTCPWKHVALDIVGPYLVRDAVKKRSTRYTSSTIKVFPVIVTCLTTRCLHVSISLSYSTEDFIIAFKEYCSLRGVPETIYSDAGSQMIKAGSLLEAEESIDWRHVSELTGRHGITWTTAPPTAQFRNGRVESLIKLFKKHIPKLIGNGKLNYYEFQSVLREACSLVNDRPLSYRKHGGAEGEFQPITPNMLLLTSRYHSPLPLLDEFEDVPEKFARRLKYRRACLEDWWYAWYVSSFDNLVVRQKWKHQHRNARVGDLVLMRPLGKLTCGEYKRGRIVDAIEDEDGLVRNVVVQTYRHDRRRQVDTYGGEGQVKIKMAVQRVIILLPVEEQEAANDTCGQARGVDKDMTKRDGQEFSIADIEEV